MNRKRYSSLAIACFCVASGCGGEKEAREYAEQLAAILKTYQQKVDAQMKTQADAYSQLAKTLDRAEKEDSIGGLDSDRLERVLTLRDELTSIPASDPVPLTASKLRQMLLEYGQIEFSENEKMLTAELEAHNQSLAGVSDLERDATAIRQLRKQLEDLSKGKNVARQIRDAAAFGQQVHREYNRLRCEGAKGQEKDLNEAIGAIKKKLDAASDDAALKTTQNKLEAALSAVTAQLAKCSSGS
ncbi:MAG: hypothetical protein IPP47_31490 [Bryobacterales bacterium]|nr:hypothetical protein [Bryobacterales bacterium]